MARIPQPQAQITDDRHLQPFLPVIRRRRQQTQAALQRLTSDLMTIEDFAAGHLYFGVHRTPGGWRCAEWAPHASALHLVGPFNGWRPDTRYAFQRVTAGGNWELTLPADALRHGELFKLHVTWPGGEGERIPAYARRVVQDRETHVFSAQVWEPPAAYAWRTPSFERPPVAPLIYEAHIGMAQEHGRVGTFEEFRRLTLPRIVDAGYNTIQLMAIQEHPYYGSFGYHVSSFFAASSRFGTPDEFKALVDDAHAAGVAVIIDLVHSHAVNNENEGLSRFDGTLYQYFHDGPRGRHEAWDSRCFDYGKHEVLHFLLSNCRFWLEEYRLDGFRFDGITSMLYLHHGLGMSFSSYGQYFDQSVDECAYTYLSLANELIHKVKPSAITIAEDVSGMPGLAAAAETGGCGFDFRLAMGVTDHWFKLLRNVKDEQWDIWALWTELTNRRRDERTISYVECHDQSIVGGKTVIFQLADAAMYAHMQRDDPDPVIDRAVALHRLLRLATLATAGHGYLNFMGNEFGHPEWVDFPREGNGWSHHYARRQWHLRDDPNLKYHFLADFDRAMLRTCATQAPLDRGQPRRLVVQDSDKVLAFERAGLLYFFNLHPTRSLTDYPIEVPAGTYDLVLDTDEARFGGHARLAPRQRYHTAPLRQQGVLRQCLKLYLPCRCGLVLQPAK